MKDRNHNETEKKTLRQKLRNNPTRAEKVLWRMLRRSGLGFKFRRQHGVGRYVLDFYCPEAKLAVELEGGIHGDPIRAERDVERHSFLASQGIHILYFRNQAVLEWNDFVLNTIRAAAKERIRI